ncbi:MAG: hypothetical protein Q8P03_01355 [bacterium]|nr:hypothetical protein [bacterium]
MNRLFGKGVNGQAKLARAAQIASAAFSEAEASRDMEDQEAERLRVLATVAGKRAAVHDKTVDRAREMVEAAHQ